MLTVSYLTRTAAALAVTVGLALTSTAQSIVVINDNFADGDRASTGPLDADWFGSSTSGAIESNSNSIGLVSGSSGRQIHAIFATQTLGTVGDSLTASLTFLTPTTVAATNEDFRLGLFDHLGRGDNPLQLFQDTSYNLSNPNADYSGLPGFYTEIDVESADPATDFDFRTSDPSTTGRLLATSSGFSTLGSGPDVGYTIVADTSYTVNVTVERTATGLDLTTALGGNSLTRSVANPGSFSFGLLALGSSSNAFGSSNSAGDPDNGIDITNFTLTTDIAAAVVPEPTSLALLGLMGCAGFIRRRR